MMLKKKSKFNTKTKNKKPKKINCAWLWLMIINALFIITINVVTWTDEKFKTEMKEFWVFWVFIAILIALEIWYVIMFARVVIIVKSNKELDKLKRIK